jgi:hypothetical protein
MRMAGPLLALASAGAALRKLVGVTREFDILNAQLVTATGSAEGAADAFVAIQDFATNTPYDLAQVTTAFGKLVNLGLTPSERALTSYGDTASAMGRDLNQMIEAVADAATGEFERLKEFGVKAKSQGDDVSFTFRGVTTTVKKEAGEIEEYLVALGENNFAGAMTERMDTLDGALSNLGDEWDKLWLNISNTGSGDIIEGAVRGAIDAIGELNDLLASGQLQAYLEAIASKFDGWVDAAHDATDAISTLFEMVFPQWAESGSGAVGEIVKGFTTLPEDIEAVMGLAGVEIWALVDATTTTGKAIYDTFVASFDAVLDYIEGKTAIIGEFISRVGSKDWWLKPLGEAWDFSDLDTPDLEETFGKIVAASGSATDKIKAQAKIREESRVEVIHGILQERNAAVDSFETQIEKADELRAAYEALKAARAAEEGDRLAAFKFDPGGEEGPTGPSKEDIKASSAFEKLRQSLLSEEEEIEESYQRRKQTILDSTLTTEEEKLAVMERLNRDHQEQIREFELSRWKDSLSSFDDFQNNLLVLARTGNKDLANVFKAAAIANTIIKTYESATSAYASLASIPYVGPALGAAAAAAAIAAGIANVQAIRAQPIGQYAQGGILGGSSPTGDQLTFQGNSGEVILNFAQQKELLDIASGRKEGGGGSSPMVKIYNLPGQTAETRTDESGNLEVTIKQAENFIAGRIASGVGPVTRALEGAYPLRRGVAS